MHEWRERMDAQERPRSASLRKGGDAAIDCSAMFRRLSANLHGRIRTWAARRHGISSDPFTIPGRRIYILPTGLGVAFAIMVFAMFLGAMNYANNLALALSFLLGALGLVAMHHCQRNLAGVRLRIADSDSVFAGETARFHLAIENPATVARYAITAANDHSESAHVNVSPDGRAVVELEVPSQRRGWLPLDLFQVSTRHPFGLFRAWTYVQLPAQCVIYPRLAPAGRAPPVHETDIGGVQNTRLGDEDFVGLRDFHAGDSPRRIAWKAYARSETLAVKQYAGSAVRSHSFDWNALDGLDTEARLSQLARWIEDAHAAGHAYSLRLPNERLATNIGVAHREQCLRALALFPQGLT
ncbi:MAG TPA: DUF58 domain-containing protein [Steroidobacteraceae bacterium]|nr:DUF58 domain-containing protein [Steroidobacteraceae bacterium]